MSSRAQSRDLHFPPEVELPRLRSGRQGRRRREGGAWTGAFGSILVSALLLAAVPAHGQLDVAGAAGRGEELTVYVMTMGPGAYVWERFGHNAIRIRDELRGTDVSYNYGMFSFDQEGFVLRFIRGHMDYWMEGFDTGLTVNAYAATDRSVWMQELNLTPEQRADLRDFLEWNALPDNRVYRYDYYRDNCSTRVRDAIDRVLEGQLAAQTMDLPSGTTYRQHTRWLMADDPVVYTGIMAGTGQPVDREISIWEEMFLPMVLRDRIRDVTVVDAAGNTVPLVVAEELVHAGSASEERAESPGLLVYLIAGLLVGGAMWGTARASGGSRLARTAFQLLAFLWAVVAGTIGMILFGAWAFTDHAAAYRNENLFLFNPLLVPLIAMVPAAAGRALRIRRATCFLAAVVASLSLIGLLVTLLPWFYQENGELLAVALPINLGLAIGAWEVWRRPETKE
ncbi:MAG: DUF4105 domain-containing protein [Gemmatimonadota bacterium]